MKQLGPWVADLGLGIALLVLCVGIAARIVWWLFT